MSSALYELTRLQIFQAAVLASPSKPQPFEAAYLHAWNHRIYPLGNERPRDREDWPHRLGYFAMRALKRALDDAYDTGEMPSLVKLCDVRAELGVNNLPDALRYFYLNSKTQEERDFFRKLEEALNIPMDTSVSIARAFEGASEFEW